MTFSNKITTAIATGAVLVNAIAPVAFAQEVNVSGNGAFSDNGVALTNNSTTSVNQTNTANVVNKVSSNASSGGNSSKFNTGGTSNITTGPASAGTTINNALNANVAKMPNCGSCAGSATDVNVAGNGAYSDNTVGVTNNKSVTLNQNNSANVKNIVDATANTGKNDSKFNTGGSTGITTGAATTVVGVTTAANANVAMIGGGNGLGGGSSVVIGGPEAVNGNGAFSDNAVAFSGNSAVVLNQGNSANVKNIVDAKSNSGKNDSKFNTGGDNSITTHAALTGVTVNNAVNFNFASVDCDCVVEGLDVAIEGNGAKSDSSVGASLNHALLDNQANAAHLWNDVDGNAKSGSNDSKFGTGGDNDTTTGETISSTEVNNAGNVNVMHNGDSIELPELGDLVDFDFDLSDLWLSLGHIFQA